MKPPRTIQRRFYTSAAFSAADGGFRIELDGKPIKTPAGTTLTVPSAPLADAIATEWHLQGDTLDWTSLGLTKIANAAIDAVAPKQAEVRNDVVKYAASDLICYRAETPASLVSLQAEAWDPVLAWFKDVYGVTFAITAGVASIQQPAASIIEIESQLLKFGPFQLSAIHIMTAISGSILLTLAHVEKTLTLAQFWEAYSIDETWQAAKWGKDYEAEKRNHARFADLSTASKFFDLCR